MEKGQKGGRKVGKKGCPQIENEFLT